MINMKKKQKLIGQVHSCGIVAPSKLRNILVNFCQSASLTPLKYHFPSNKTYFIDVNMVLSISILRKWWPSIVYLRTAPSKVNVAIFRFFNFWSWNVDQSAFFQIQCWLVSRATRTLKIVIWWCIDIKGILWDRRWIAPSIGIFSHTCRFSYRNAFLLMKLSNPPSF